MVVRDEGPRRVPADERRIQRWLDCLRDGREADKIAARRGLAGVFEGRGMLTEAIELLERNVEAGVRSPETLRWLSRLYQALDDEAKSLGAAVDALRQQPPSGPDQASVGEVWTRPTRGRPLRGLAPYVVMVLGMGAAIGASAWMLTPLLAR